MDDKLKVMNDVTLNYYDQNAKAFIHNTRDLDFSAIQNRFLQYVPDGGLICDLGCGSGRDAKAFLDAGYLVKAIDGSAKLCQITSRWLQIPVECQSFDQFHEQNQFDGLWACSSLLHCPKKDLPDLFSRIENSLKPGGVFYCSFKQSDFEGFRNGRYFSDLTIEALDQLIQTSTTFQPLAYWTSEDVRADRPSEKWTNALFQKPEPTPELILFF